MKQRDNSSIQKVDQDLSLEELIRLICRNKYIFILSIVFGLGTGVVYGIFIRPAHYETSLRMPILSSSPISKSQAATITSELLNSELFLEIFKNELNFALDTNPTLKNKISEVTQKYFYRTVDNFDSSTNSLSDVIIREVKENSIEQMMLKTTPSDIAIFLDGKSDEWVILIRVPLSEDLTGLLTEVKDSFDHSAKLYNEKISKLIASESNKQISLSMENLKVINKKYSAELEIFDRLNRLQERNVESKEKSTSLDRNPSHADESNKIHDLIIQVYVQSLKSKIIADEILLIPTKTNISTFSFIPRFNNNSNPLVSKRKYDGVNFFLAIGFFVGTSIGLAISLLNRKFFLRKKQ